MLALGLIFELIFWFLGFYLMEYQSESRGVEGIARIIAIGSFAVDTQLWVAAQNYVLESGSTLTSVTLALPATLQGFVVLLNTFFLVFACAKAWDDMRAEEEG